MLGSTVMQVFLVPHQTLCQQKHLHRQGTSLLLQYLPHHQLLHVVGVNVEMAFVPRLAGVAQYGDIVELELNIVLVVNFMAMRMKNEVLMFNCRILVCNILTGGDENYLRNQLHV